MARKEHEESSEMQQHLPKTIGDLLPGIAQEVWGVNVHSPPIGLLQELLIAGIKSEVSKVEKHYLGDISIRENKEEAERLRGIARVHVAKIFAEGLLPSDYPDENEFVMKEAVKHVDATRKANASAQKDPEAYELAWFKERMSAEDFAVINEPRSRSRSNCVKRVAGEFLAKAEETLPEKARVKRAALIAHAKESYGGTLTALRNRVSRLSVQLLDPMNVPAPEAAAAPSVEADEDVGF